VKYQQEGILCVCTRQGALLATNIKGKPSGVNVDIDHK